MLGLLPGTADFDPGSESPRAERQRGRIETEEAVFSIILLIIIILIVLALLGFFGFRSRA